jgi:hypothetical protein
MVLYHIFHRQVIHRDTYRYIQYKNIHRHTYTYNTYIHQAISVERVFCAAVAAARDSPAQSHLS